MKSKPPFEAEHNCICAFDGMPILEFYKGYFDSVYIILHPFYSLNYDNGIEKTVTWAEMVTLTQFRDINQLDIACRNTIGGLIDKWKNNEDKEKLNMVCKANNLLMPCKGQFDKPLDIEMLLSLQEQGHHYIFVADEFGFERKVTYIQDYIEGTDKPKLQWGRENWYTPKNEILYTSHWDSHFTLLCSDKRTIESILSKHAFEGFYCDKDTEIYWSCRAYEKANMI